MTTAPEAIDANGVPFRPGDPVRLWEGKRLSVSRILDGGLVEVVWTEGKKSFSQVVEAKSLSRPLPRD